MSKLPSFFSLHRLVSSFGFAARGICLLFTHTPNARIHLLALLIVVSGGLFFSLTRIEWVGLVLCFVIVLGAEAFNSSLETLADILSAEYDPIIRDAKDLAAAAVLIAALGSAVIGTLVFWPHICKLLVH